MNNYLVKVSVKIIDTESPDTIYRPIKLDGIYSSDKKVNVERDKIKVEQFILSRLKSQTSHRDDLKYVISVGEFVKKALDFHCKNT